MIVVDEGKRRRAARFECWRERGTDNYYLTLLINSTSHPHLYHRCHGIWNIPVEYGGKLATTAPRYQDCYNVSWRKLKPEFAAKVLVAIKYIEANGTPHENDEHVFSKHYGT